MSRLSIRHGLMSLLSRLRAPAERVVYHLCSQRVNGVSSGTSRFEHEDPRLDIDYDRRDVTQRRGLVASTGGVSRSWWQWTAILSPEPLFSAGTKWWDDRGWLRLASGLWAPEIEDVCRCCWYFRHTQTTDSRGTQHTALGSCSASPTTTIRSATRGLGLIEVSQNKTAAWLRSSVARPRRAKSGSAGGLPPD